MNIDEENTVGDLCWLIYDHAKIGKQYSINLYKQLIEGFEDSMVELQNQKLEVLMIL